MSVKKTENKTKQEANAETVVNTEFVTKPSEEKKSPDNIIVEETKINETVEKEPRKIASSDFISCRSVTAGELIAKGRKTGTIYIWTAYGDTTDVEFVDLQAWNSAKSGFVYEPLFVIEDEDVLAMKQYEDLKEIYSTFYGVDNLNKFFELDNKTFKKKLEALPTGIQNSIKSIAADMLESGKLDSLDKIKSLDTVLGTDLMTFLK